MTDLPPWALDHYETWSEVQELTELRRAQPSTSLWKVDQTFGDKRSPRVKGLELLCLHLIAALHLGRWDNEALVLMDMLYDELKSATLLPVGGLLTLLAKGLQAAPSHREHILLVPLWQLAKMLEELFPDESRFGDVRRAIDSELLSTSPWCSRVTQAIADGAIQGLCSSQDAQLYGTHGLGVLIGPCKRLYLALDIQSQRMWIFYSRDMEIAWCPSRGYTIVIPGFSRNPITGLGPPEAILWYPRIDL
jgi:hypothetical protein